MIEVIFPFDFPRNQISCKSLLACMCTNMNVCMYLERYIYTHTHTHRDLNRDITFFMKHLRVNFRGHVLLLL